MFVKSSWTSGFLVTFLLPVSRCLFLRGSLSDIYRNLMMDVDRNQCKMTTPNYFPCSHRAKSYPTPTSVNQLQPGDISIVAALGDSVMSASGASSPSLLQIREQYRGVSFSIGAYQNWRTVTTLPNILRVFNPSLAGGSVNLGDREEEGNNLNLCQLGATSETLIEQAKLLIKLLSNKKDLQRWKLVTIMIGHNDVCSHACNNVWTAFDASPLQYTKRVTKALDMLRDNLPRTFVNVVPLFDIAITLDMKDKSPFCTTIAMPWVCSCLYPSLFPAYPPLGRSGMRRLQKGYMNQLEDVIKTGRFERNDFTVVTQPAFTNFKLFTKLDEKNQKVTDYSYFAPDCMHPSQKLHGLMARSLWNNMLTPLGRKETVLSKDPPLLCPTPSSPYLATRLNSWMANTTQMKTDYDNYMTEVHRNNIKCFI